MSTTASDGSAGAGASSSAGCSKDTPTDTMFPVSDFILEYGANFESQCFAAMQMNGNSTSIWDVHGSDATAILRWVLGRRNCGTEVVIGPSSVFEFAWCQYFVRKLFQKGGLWKGAWAMHCFHLIVGDVWDSGSNWVDSILTAIRVHLAALKWTYWGLECEFVHSKSVAGRNVFVRWHNV